MNIVVGDLIKMFDSGAVDVMVHGCNCFCTMGAGIAKTIATTYPAVKEADLKTKVGDRNKLGTIMCVPVLCADWKTRDVVNAYTQYGYNRGGMNLSYDALRDCLCHVRDMYPGKKIGLPKIGCGLAGGDWNVVLTIIHSVFNESDNQVVIVEFAQQ